MAEEINFDDIKEEILGTAKKKKPTEAPSKKKREKEIESVEEIIQRLTEKYEKEGAYIKKGDDNKHEVMIQKLLTPSISVSGSPEDLAESENAFVRFIGKIYLSFQRFFDSLIKGMADREYIKKLDWDLYAANMPFTGLQYLAFVVVLSFMLSILAFIFSVPLFISAGGLLAVIGPIAVFVFVFLLALVIGKGYPTNVAQARSRAAEKYLPFALRHLAVEIRAGMGLYQAMKAVADADYGVLSEEFKRTLKEIDEGKSTEIALSNLAQRMRTRGIRRAIANILRAVRIGGNLSDSIMEIASDVSFEQRMRVAEYGEKLNFMGVIYMYAAVVGPVMIAILTSIGNVPVKGGFLSVFRFPPELLTLAFAVLLPGFLVLFWYFVRSMDPLR